MTAIPKGSPIAPEVFGIPPVEVEQKESNCVKIKEQKERKWSWEEHSRCARIHELLSSMLQQYTRQNLLKLRVYPGSQFKGEVVGFFFQIGWMTSFWLCFPLWICKESWWDQNSYLRSTWVCLKKTWQSERTVCGGERRLEEREEPCPRGHWKPLKVLWGFEQEQGRDFNRIYWLLLGA